MIRYIYRHTEGKLPIVGVGGIDSAAAALEKIKAGATLVQVYTGMIYSGPGLVKAINKGLLESEVRSLAELVGSES
jgi:dihydroorotate dehydrogenase